VTRIGTVVLLQANVMPLEISSIEIVDVWQMDAWRNFPANLTARQLSSYTPSTGSKADLSINNWVRGFRILASVPECVNVVFESEVNRT
jgi:hypothetical protein